MNTEDVPFRMALSIGYFLVSHVQAPQQRAAIELRSARLLSHLLTPLNDKAATA
jgi:hypothetical protein